MSTDTYPSLPYPDWEQSKITLHLFTQIVGKIRLNLSPQVNHWWHVPFYISGRGLTTSAIPVDGRSLEMEFDFVDHTLVVRDSDGFNKAIGLQDLTVAAFYNLVMETLKSIRVHPRILAVPFDSAKVGSDIPFADDTTHAGYDREYVSRFFRILTLVDPVFRAFRGRFQGKCSPIHFFWHSFDLAVTRFSGKAVEVSSEADSVTQDAYSHEVISAGFWPGDGVFPEPAFYAYAYPEPDGIANIQLKPKAAWWQEMNGAHLAVYRYDDFRTSSDPEGDLVAFLQSSYEAGAGLGNWPRSELERG